MTRDIMPKKEDVAVALAQAHYKVEPGLQAIYRLVCDHVQENDPDEPIKLLEVNADTIPSGIQPVEFGPHPSSGVYYASVVVEITPDEFHLIGEKKLALPDGWRIGQLYSKPA